MKDFKLFAAAVLLACAQTAASNAAVFSWNNAAGGNWNVASDWSSGTVPISPGQAADIPATLAVTVNLNVSPSIDSLSIDNSGSILNILGGQTLTVTNGISNNGTITLDPTGVNSTTILTLSGSQTLGNVILNNVFAQLNTSNSGVLTEPAGNTISGWGTINAALINQGLVNANVNGQTLTLATNPMTNTGTMETSNSGVLNIATSLNNTGGTIQSSGGGSLQISGGTLSNTGGTIQASGGSNLQITNATVNNTAGGTLLASGGTSLQITNATVNSTSGGTFLASGVSVQITNSTINGGTLAMTGSMNLSTASVVNLNGVALSIGSGSQFNVTAGANTTLAGGSFTDNGTITLDPTGVNSTTILTLSGSQTLGNVILNNVFAQLNTSNSGVLTEPAGNTISGWGTINAALINQGLVNANVNGQTLTLATNPMTNTGTMETSNSGVLNIATSLNNTGGTIQSSGGGSLQISGGTLSNTGGTIQASGGSNLQITNATVNNTAGGTLLASGGTSLQITNATVNSTSGGTFLASGVSVQITNSTINGGTLAMTGSMNLSTASVVNLNGVALSIGSGSQFNVTAGANTTLAGGSFTDNGTITLDPTGVNSTTILTLSGSQTLGNVILNNVFAQLNTSNSGVLTEPAGNTISGWGTINAALINQGLVNANVNGQTLTLATNPMTNTGTMETSNSGVLNIATSLNNTGGTIQSSGGGSLQISGGTLSNTGGTIQASGGSNLQITNATVNNTAGGTLLASGGTSLQITNATVNSTSGGTFLASGVSVQITNSTINGGTLAMTGSMNLSTASVVNLNGVALSIGSGSQFNVTAGANTTLAGGSFTDNGTITLDPTGVNSTTILTLSGSQTLGNVILNNVFAQLNTSNSGVLTEPAGNTISGWGTINAALINQGLVNANVNGQTLTLVTSAKVNLGTMETSNSGVLNIATSLNNTGGTIQSSGGGSLQISGGTLSNTGGTIQASGGSNLQITNATVNNTAGGTLLASGGTSLQITNATVNSTSGGTFLASGVSVQITNSTINGGTLAMTGSMNLSTASVVNLNGVALSIGSGSQFNVTAGANTTLAGGSFTDSGTITLDPTGINTTTILTLSGSQTLGNVILNNVFAQLNTSNSGLLTEPAGNTISGWGTINAALINQGLVNANVNGQTLTLATNAKVSSGTIETTNGGVLNITTNIKNTGGLILAGSGAININSGATITGGTLTSLAGSAFSGNGSVGLSNVVLSASSQYNMPSGQTTTVSGGLENDGLITGAGTLKHNSGTLELGAQAAISLAGVQINGGSLLADSPASTITSNFTYASPLASTYQGVLAGAGNSLVVNNPTGLLVLSGTSNTIGGGTTINAGTLLISGAGGLPSTAPLTVNGDSSFSLADGTARNTTVSKLTLTNGSNLVFDWVNNVADKLISTAAATTSGYVGISVVITGVPNGTQTLLTALSGLQAPNNTKYLLGDAFNYTAVLTQSDTAVGISLYTAVTPLSSAYWLGGLVPGGGNAMALSNASTSNWASSAGGAYANGLIPGPTTDVFFSATGATLQSGIVLGNNMAANSLTFSSTGVTIAADANQLTLFSSGTGAASAISANQNATVNANLVLGSNQTWTIASGKTLTVGGTILGTNSLTKAGSGTLILSGTNIYSGGTIVLDGTLIATKSKAFADGSNLYVGTDSALFGAVVPSSYAPARSSAIAPVPEPGTLALVATVAMFLTIYRWRPRRDSR